jgi:hypothetical protein
MAEYYEKLKHFIKVLGLELSYSEEIYISYDENRMSLVKRITDEELLKTVFENDSVWAIKLSALVKITDEEYLKKVALEHHDLSFKKECLDRINDQYFIKDLCSKYTKDEDSDFLIFLINKIIIKSFLLDIKKFLIKKRVSNPIIFAAITNQLDNCSNSISFMFD